MPPACVEEAKIDMHPLTLAHVKDVQRITAACTGGMRKKLSIRREHQAEVASVGEVRRGAGRGQGRDELQGCCTPKHGARGYGGGETEPPGAKATVPMPIATLLRHDHVSSHVLVSRSCTPPFLAIETRRRLELGEKAR